MCFKVNSDDVWDGDFPSIKLLKDMKNEEWTLHVICFIQSHNEDKNLRGLYKWAVGKYNNSSSSTLLLAIIVLHRDFFVKMIMYKGSNKTFIMHFYHPHYTIPPSCLFCPFLCTFAVLMSALFDVMCCANRKDRADWERKSLKFKQKFVGNQ